MKHPAYVGRMACCFGLLTAVLLLGTGGKGHAQVRRGVPTAVVINEILASNSLGIADPQGEHDDWIELYNTGNLAVDVGGCYLTDDLSRPTRWRIPADDPAATTIPAGGYLLIWADGQTAERGLHAGFRLSAGGEEVAFYAPDGETLIDSLSFDEQRTDISYGRYPDGSEELRFMASPSPQAANVSTYEGICEDPQISVESRLCTEPIAVTLTTTTEGATIYYTTDGSHPFTEIRGRAVGTSYGSPMSIAKTTTVKAITWRPGWRQSEVVTRRYIFIAADLLRFSSPLPIAIVDSLGKGVSTTQTPAFASFFDLGRAGRAAVGSRTDFSGQAAINIRGKSSEGFAKHQYHFETWDNEGRDAAVSILGLPAESDWVLQGPYSDKSLMRNVLSYQWSNEMGQYAPRTRFIEMFLNSDNSALAMNDYIGVYVLMEKIKIGPNRVDVARLDPGDVAEPQITGGYIIKKDKLDPTDVTFSTSRGQSLVYMDPDGHELSQAQQDWIKNYINAFETALYGANFQDPVNGYAKYIDVDSFIDIHILVELTKNIDGFRLSTYMSKDRNGKLTMGPAWDYNLSLGNANYLDGWNATGWYYPQLDDGAYPYWRRLFQDPAFQLRYADRWFTLRNDLFTTSRLLGIVEAYASLLDEPALRNFDRWRILGVYVWPNWFIAKTFREEIAWMQGWLADRLAWMDSQIAADFAPVPPGFNRQGGQVDAGFELTMTSLGPVYYTVDGSDPWVPIAPVGAANMTLVPETASKRVLVPAGPVDDAWRGGGAFDDSAWTLVPPGSGSIGYDRSARQGSRFGLDVGPQMYEQQTSCYVRIPFALTGRVRDVGRLMLNVRYNDGFIAYLNGVEIARRNFTGRPGWNAAADGRVAGQSVSESIDVLGSVGALQRSGNVLAIHAMNVSPASTDFLISVELTTQEVLEPLVAPQVSRYTVPIRLTETTRVKARGLVGGRWSALNEAVFAVGPVAEGLRISEIMYRPLETGRPDDPNTEYIELMNVGVETLDLNFVRFTDGVQFTFPSFDLPPGDICLVVRDVAAFEARYGPGLPVAGRYTGSLNNAGERIVLEDAAGRVIHDFAYRDDWYDSTDGEGFSLTIVDPWTVDPNGLSEVATWRPSPTPGGSPGFYDIR